MIPLETSGYVYDEGSRIWIRPDYAGISYNDGDEHENRLAGIVQQAGDLSVFSIELAGQCTDWPSLYHLSSLRGNILRPFERYLKGRVLEIGAGCGAITRYLGEAGGEILALEGSPRRAAIAASRTRDLPNVTVLAERFDDFRCEEKFDAITLVGVLEYASMFSGGDDPACNMLARVRQLLKPEGRLFIAIENQLGLKYFAGAPEDHLGQAMYGIEGRYRPGQPQTYGRVQLQDLILRAGFASTEFLAPFPDYKLPVSLITEKGFQHTQFDAAALASQSVARDPQLPVRTHFDLVRAWPVVFSNELGLEIANSHLVVASPTKQGPGSDSVLAYHYSTNRHPAYCKETRFTLETDGSVVVRYQKLSRTKYLVTDDVEYGFSLPEKAAYIRGRPLSLDFVALTTSPNWTMKQAGDLVRRYLDQLLILSGQPKKFDSIAATLPGSFIDALPQNIVISKEGNTELIDQEWERRGTIEVGYLVFRTLLWMVDAIKHDIPEDIAVLPRAELMIHVMNAAGLAVTEQDIARYDAMEVEFQTVVHGRAAGRRLDSDQRSIGAIAGKTELSAVLYFADDDLRFSEAQSIYQPLRQGRQVIRFRLDGTRGPIRQLRCDPMDRPGFLILYSLEVADAQGHTLWRLPADSGQQAMVGLRRALRSPDGEVLFALDDDPQILIPFSLPQHLLSGLSVLLDVEVLCKEQIAHHAMAMDATVAVQAEELGLLTRTLTDREQQLSHMGNDLSRAQQQLAAANHVVEELIRALDEIRSSSSWRLTKPVRHAGRLARIGRNVGRAGLTLLEREGVANLSKKVARVWQREGLAGVISRIRQQHREAMLKPKTEFAPSAPADFQVKLAKAALVRSSHGKYSLVTSSDRYVYIPPQCPEDLDARLELLSSTPRFSIVVPIYNTPPALLSALLDSVQSQWYPHWELILANDASPAQETLAALARVNDPRIKVMHLETNQGIAGATNAALAAATGDFIVFLDHDDELTVDCLYELALCIDRDAPDFVYSDEDKLTEAGEYTQPHFKPDWSPDTMMSTMFTCHVSCVRRSLVEKLAGLRPDYDGCQDWDFVLRLSEHTSRISHIPKVLYHWRIIPASTAADIAAKPYVLDASRRVREDALARRGLAGSVEPVVQVPGYFRVHYHMRGEPLISIIIPTRDNEAVLRRCIESILQNTSYRRFELVVLDNGSVQPGTLAYLNDLRGQDGITVVRHDAPFNFSELNNIGVKASTGELLLFLNDDTEVLSADWLERMGGYAQLSHVGAVGAKLLYPGRNQIQHAGILNLRNGPVHAFLQQEADSPGYFMRNLLEYNWVAVTGACLMIERQKFLQIGGFCEDLPVAYNDVDLCLRLLDVGLYNVVCQAVRLVHHESVSRGMDHLDPVKRERLERELAYLYEKNPAYFQHDPFHNPNLHPNGLNFEVPA